MARKPRKDSAKADSKNNKTKKAAQTNGEFERDPKGRVGQYTAAGSPALTKK
jgi:hypothetical protein